MKAGRPKMVLGYNFFQKFKIFKNIFSKISKNIFKNFKKIYIKKCRMKLDKTNIIQL